MIRKTLIAAATLATLASGAFAQDKLRIGVEGAYPPFSFKQADGSLAGFDIDIAMALCAEMKRDCELVEQDWDGMIPALKAKKFDAIVASMSITEERKRQIDFSAKYYKTPARVVAKKNSALKARRQGWLASVWACSAARPTSAMPKRCSPRRKSSFTARRKKCSATLPLAGSTRNCRIR